MKGSHAQNRADATSASRDVDPSSSKVRPREGATAHSRSHLGPPGAYQVNIQKEKVERPKNRSPKTLKRSWTV